MLSDLNLSKYRVTFIMRRFIFNRKSFDAQSNLILLQHKYRKSKRNVIRPTCFVVSIERYSIIIFSHRLGDKRNNQFEDLANMTL